MHIQMVLNFLEIRILTLNNYELVRADDVTIGKASQKQDFTYEDSVLDKQSNQIKPSNDSKKSGSNRSFGFGGR